MTEDSVLQSRNSVTSKKPYMALSSLIFTRWMQIEFHEHLIWMLEHKAVHMSKRLKMFKEYLLKIFSMTLK